MKWRSFFVLRFLRKYGALTAIKIIFHEILFKFQYAVDTGGVIEITSKDAITENFKLEIPLESSTQKRQHA